MSWPLSQDYNEAIQNPQLAFSDPELRSGEAATNALGLPIPRSGNFADVYDVSCPSTGTRWAVKCFTREVPGLRERYAEIGKHLAQLRLPFAVEFQYLEQGIRTLGRWYPVLKMRWVEGLLLNEFIRGAVDKPQTLEALGKILARVAQRLREGHLAHADLQHGNVILVPGSSANALAVKLIDYDGMFVPALDGQRSGEVGHPAYQHAQRLREGTYSAEVDRFPLLLCYTAIHSLLVGGRSLWDRYDNGDNLLFREEDLRQPAESALFRELWNIPQATVHDLVGHLALAAVGPMEQVPLLDQLLTNGTVLPLSAPQEKQVNALLGPGASVTRKGIQVKATPPLAPPVPLAAPVKSTVPQEDPLDFEPAPRKAVGRRPKAAPASRLPLLIGLGAGAGGLGVLGLAAGVVLFLMLGHRSATVDTEKVVAQVDHRATQQDTRLPIASPAATPRAPVPIPPPVNPVPPPVVVVNNPPPEPATLTSVPFNSGWDRPVDPDSDCKFTQEKNSLTIEVPARDHELTVEDGMMNAPRLLRDVEGDFTAQVRVSGDFHLAPASTSKRHGAFLAAGFVLLADDQNYLRLERAARGQGTQGLPYANWEQRSAGKFLHSIGRNQAADGPLWLRLQRQGNHLVASISLDGEKWDTLRSLDVQLPARVKLGLSAQTTSTSPFLASFEDFRLTSAAGTTEALSFESGWDRPVDPDSDCKFTQEKNTLTIEVPARDHELTAEDGMMNAPRLLRDVEGDFTAQVRVSGDFQLAPASTSKRHGAFLAAGFVLLADDQNYLRLERAARGQGAQGLPYANWEQRSAGKFMPLEWRNLPAADGPVWLRLQRQGSHLVASVSLDGDNWAPLKTLDVQLPARVKLGLSAQTTSTSPFQPRFDDFRLSGTLQNPGELRMWATTPPTGSRAVRFSPDGRRALFVENQSVSIWDVNTGGQLMRSANSNSTFADALFSADGRLVYIAGYDKTIKVLNAQDGSAQAQFQGMTEPPHCLAVSPDGRRLFSGGGDRQDFAVRVWDTANGTELYRFTQHAGSVTHISLSSDGQRVLSVSNDAAWLWDAASGREIRRVCANQPGMGYRRAVLLPGGHQALVTLDTSSIRLWDVDTDQEVRRFGECPGTLTGDLAVSADGRLALSNTAIPNNVNGKLSYKESVIHLWEVQSGRELRRFESPGDAVQSLAFSPDGRRALSNGYVTQVVRLWDLGGEPVVAANRPAPPVTTVSNKPPSPEAKPATRRAQPAAAEQEDAEKLIKELYKEDYSRTKGAERSALATKLEEKAKATRDDMTARFVLFREAEQLAAQAGDAAASLVIIDELAEEYDVETLALKRAALNTAAQAATSAGASKGVAESALTVLEDAVAVDNYEVALEMLNLAEAAARKAQTAALTTRVTTRGKEVRTAQKEYDATRAAAELLRTKPDDAAANAAVGKYLCFRQGNWDKGLPLLARGDDEALQKLAQDDLARPRGADDQVKVGDAWWTLAEKKSELGGAQIQRRACAWYQQALGGLTGITQDRVEKRLKQAEEQTTNLHSLGMSGELCRLTGHTARVTSVALSRDGHILISGGADGSVRLWDPVKGKEVQQLLDSRGEVRGVALTPDAHYAMAIGSDGIWQCDLEGDRQMVRLHPLGGSSLQSLGGSRFLSGGGSGWETWSTDNRQPQGGLSVGGWGQLRWAGMLARRYVVCLEMGGTVHLWDQQDGKEVGKGLHNNPPISNVAVPPEGYEAAVSVDKQVQLVDLKPFPQAPVVRQFRGHTGKVTALAFSPDGRWLLTGSEDKTVRLWEVKSGRELRRFSGHTEPISCVAFSGDGRQAVSGSDDKTVRVWDLPRASANP